MPVKAERTKALGGHMVVSEVITPVVSKIDLQIINGFSLAHSSGQEISIPNRKACGLLAYLALSNNSSQSREHLAGLLWSDRSEEQARASLRQCLKQLRNAFEGAGFYGFSTDRLGVSLSKDQFNLDLDGIINDLKRGELADRLIAGEAAPDRLLYGYETLDQAFASWLYVARQRWHDRLMDQLHPLIAPDCRFGPQVARKAAEALISTDPTHEEAHRCVIRYHASNGNVPAALKQYKVIWDLLDDEYDMEPAEETQALIADIKSGNFSATNESDAVALSQTRQVAVQQAPGQLVVGIRPFSAAGASDGKHYLVDGFRSEMIASLIRFREWIVVEGRWSFNARDQGNSGNAASAIADYQVEGTFQECAGSIRLIITLREVASNRYIWSEHIPLNLESWFDAQQKIVRRIALALNIYLSAERLARVAGQPDVSLDVYDRWLRGQELTLEWRPGAHSRAREVFQTVIQETPWFGRAISSLVQIENADPLVHPGTYRTRDTCERSVDLAKQAVQLDPLDSRAQLCLGWAYAINGQHERAEMNFGLACELNQNDPWTLVSSALGWAFCDRIDVAGQLSEQAMSLGLQPSNSHWGYIATIRFLSGNYEGCVSAVNEAEDVLCNLPGWKTASLYHLGRLNEARQTAQHFLKLIRHHWSDQTTASDEAVSSWFLQCFPIRNPYTWRRLRDGLEGAGVPISDGLLEPPHLRLP